MQVPEFIPCVSQNNTLKSLLVLQSDSPYLPWDRVLLESRSAPEMKSVNKPVYSSVTLHYIYL